MKKGKIFPRCHKCKRSIMKPLDGRCIQKETTYLKPVWEHIESCAYYKRMA